ncbi:hypothetical protein GCM10007916_01460 [Psychromonas marina]|uniref:Site-specific integrase n=1 Tax=Psychromonas marina TaxID=88364 RepID=A0ABQ6DVK4_9GAMM|nr:hypothetical protein [Psychromonas marina]GLS89079.1 hypothetical protein GCM10007916_01460 [Psychromonas marina]
MIKITNIDHFEAINRAQMSVGAQSNYLIDILKPAIKLGNWDQFEELDIGFDQTGQSLGKIGDNEAWKKLQPFFEPEATKNNALDFSLDGKIIERNLQNELKSLILKMMWISPKYHSYDSIYKTLTVLKKLVNPLISEGVNSLSHVNFDNLERWIIEGATDIDFRRGGSYGPINKLFIEKNGLPFSVKLTSTLNHSDFKLTLKEQNQYPVIPLRLYYRALCEAESLINYLFSIRDKIEAISTYLVNFQDNIYKGYAKYLHQGIRKRKNGEYIWRLSNANRLDKVRNQVFKEKFLGLTSPTEKQIIALIQEYQISVNPSFYDVCYPNREITLASNKINTAQQAQTVLSKYSGGCIWTLLAKSGMRGDEIAQLHTTDGCILEVISNQKIYILNADLSKTVKGSQSTQDEFVTTELGMKAYEILQSIYRPLRNNYPESKKFFRMLENGFGEISKKSIARQAKKWFYNTLASELTLTNQDIKDLKISEPEKTFKLGEKYEFSCHQLRRSFAYYLIGYELLSFPQLKQQFSHISLAMTRHYAKNASKFQKLRKKKGKNKNLCTAIDDERVQQKAQIYLNIYHRLANKERVAGGKGKAFAKRRTERNDNNLFTDKTNNDTLTLEYWENIVRNGQRHIHVVAPGIFCTSANCSLRTQVNLIECVDCNNDYIVDAVYAEAMRKEAEEHMYYDITYNELTPQTASELYIKITAAERIMDDLGVDYESVELPQEVQDMLIPQAGVTL